MTALAIPLPEPTPPAPAEDTRPLVITRLIVLGMTYLVLIVIVLTGHPPTTALELALAGGCLTAALADRLTGARWPR